MSETTAIEWTDHTWSPWEGCSKISPGCANCYASEGNARWRGGKNWGPGAPRREMSAAHWKLPGRWNKRAAAEGRRARVFPSICDPFDAEVPDGWLDSFWELIHATPHLDWLLLTKRPERAAALLPWPSGVPSPWRNVWIGTSVEDRERKSRIDALRALPATLRFLSIEPLLEDLGELDLRGIAWVIVGGESGRKARPCSSAWIGGVRDQCKATGVPLFVKQWGSRPTYFQPAPMGMGDFEYERRLANSKGGDPSEWPADLRIREFPAPLLPRSET